jgi:hypothetical protein
MIIKVRSPYFIEVNETGQVGSKIEIFIWNNGQTEPVLGAVGTYVLAKPIPSISQIKNVYNISPFITEFIDNISPLDSVNNMSVNVKVKRYKETAINVYSLLDTTSYVAVEGYTNYMNGYNQGASDNGYTILSDASIQINYDRSISYPFVNVYALGITPFDTFNATYTDLSGSNATVVNYNSNANVMLKIPYTLSDAAYDNANILTIQYVSGLTSKTSVIRVIPIEECKYEPVVCTFINRFGGWQFLTFFKVQINSIEAKGTGYKMLPSDVNYNPLKGQNKSFNINGGQSVRLNTGFVPENYSDLIQDLLLSETVLLDGKPVEVKTQSNTLKTGLQDRNINYEIEFTYSFDLINNVC